jgi:hypothetical protein
MVVENYVKYSFGTPKCDVFLVDPEDSCRLRSRGSNVPAFLHLEPRDEFELLFVQASVI